MSQGAFCIKTRALSTKIYLTNGWGLLGAGWSPVEYLFLGGEAQSFAYHRADGMRNEKGFPTLFEGPSPALYLED